MLSSEDRIELDAIDLKLNKAFPGRIVRKDLVKKLKVGFNIPVYVLEYLLGKYCSTSNEEEIQKGLNTVKSIIAERIVQGDESELIKARLRRYGSIKLIDLVTVIFDEKDKSGKYWGKMATCGIDHIHIDESIVHQYERLLTGGVWANVELIYDDTMIHKGVTRPFVIRRLSPIQIASANFSEYVEGRTLFTRDEWIDVLMRTIGYEPGHPDFTPRLKMLFLLRLIPMVEKNYNIIELGPRGTGKSFVFREISPYIILLSGGQGTVPDLFGWKNRKDKPGLVVKYDTVAFDEVAGGNFKNETDKQMFKGYMEQGSFSRGDDKGTLQADAGIIFNGNIDGDVETLFKISHLFSPLPDTLKSDMAFHDRWHAYLPGWEIPKMQPDYFTCHFGFVSDYISEIFHSELRKKNYTDTYMEHFKLGNHIEERDKKAIAKTTSGFIKLLHPDGKCSLEEIEEYLFLALEVRRRVKEQLKRMGGIEYSRVNFSFINKITGEEKIISCSETGTSQIIPEGVLSPGDVFTVGYDPQEKRYSLYRIQVSASPGNHRFNLLGTPGKMMKESAKMSYDYIRQNMRKISPERDISNYDINLQIINPMQGKDAKDLGIVFFIAILSAILQRSIAPKTVVLGDMTIHGVLNKVEGLGDKLRIAMDSGAKRVVIPTTNVSDFSSLPSDTLDKLRIDFYSDPLQSAFKMFTEE